MSRFSAACLGENKGPGYIVMTSRIMRSRYY